MTNDPLNFPEKLEHFFLTGEAGKLEVKAQGAQNASVTVLICHPHPLYGGTMENKVVTTLFRAFAGLNTNVVRFNYRGVGKSEGSYGEALGETEDLLTVFNWVKSVEPETDIWLAGFSFGSYVATRAAQSVQAKQLLTVAPAVEHFDFDSITYPECPWLVIQGTEDEVVPPDLVYQWIDKQSNPPALVKVSDTGHFFHKKLIQLKEIVMQHYSELLM